VLASRPGTYRFLPRFSPTAGLHFSAIRFAGVHRFVSLGFAVTNDGDFGFASGTLVGHDGGALLVLAAFRNAVHYDDWHVPAQAAGIVDSLYGTRDCLGVGGLNFGSRHEERGALALRGGGRGGSWRADSKANDHGCDRWEILNRGIHIFVSLFRLRAVH
jgi:hypothetical protein